VFAYHDVGPTDRNFTRYSVSPGRLRWQLRTAQSWGLRFVALSELVDALLTGGELDGRGAVVFDDGLIGVHRHAAPILAELGIPATLFAVSGALGTSPPWWPGSARVMTGGELRELVEGGFAVASHARTHRSLPQLPWHELRGELRGSRSALEDLLGQPIDYFAYPFGHHDHVVRAAVLEAGYRAAFTFVNGRVTPGLDPARIPRLTMHQGLHRVRLAHYLARPAGRWPDTQMDAMGAAHVA